MRSPFGPLQRWFSGVLASLQDGVEALQGILGSIRVLIDAVHGFESRESATPAPADDIRIDYLATRIDDLTLAVDTGVNNVQRSERRVRAIVQSARRALADAGYSHAGLEAEADQLREVDGESGDGETVPAVSEVLVEPSQAQHSVIPGVSVRQMQLARARHR